MSKKTPLFSSVQLSDPESTPGQYSELKWKQELSTERYEGGLRNE